MVDIIFVRSIIYDAVIVRVLRSLGKRYSAVLLGWNREGISKDVQNEMLQKTFSSDLPLRFMFLEMKGPHQKHLLRSYISMIIYLPIFWSWVFLKLIVHRPKLVHAFDLDTVFPCYVYKKLFQRKLVFHIVDRYAMSFIPKKFKRLYSVVNFIEDAFSKRSDVLITVSENVLKSFRNKPNKTAVILNCPEDYYIKRDQEDGILVLGYTGAINNGRGLEQFATVLGNLNNVKLRLYGPVIDKKLYNDLNRQSNIEYKGFLPSYDDYQRAIIDTDALVAVYTREIIGNQITMHNKTLEAMMGGIPIITNLSPQFVNEVGFGIIVEYGNIDQITTAIKRLRDDPEYRKRLGSNGRKAFLEKYNWGIMEKKLYDVYENIL